MKPVVFWVWSIAELVIRICNGLTRMLIFRSNAVISRYRVTRHRRSLTGLRAKWQMATVRLSTNGSVVAICGRKGPC